MGVRIMTRVVDTAVMVTDKATFVLARKLITMLAGSATGTAGNNDQSNCEMNRKAKDISQTPAQ